MPWLEQLVDAEGREAAGARRRRVVSSVVRATGLFPSSCSAFSRYSALGEVLDDAVSKTGPSSRASRWLSTCLDVVGEAPGTRARGVDGCGGDHWILVRDQLEQCFLNVAWSGREQYVLAPYLLLDRYPIEHGHDALAEPALEDVVQVSDASARVRSSSLASVDGAAVMSCHGRDQRQERVYPGLDAGELCSSVRREASDPLGGGSV